MAKNNSITPHGVNHEKQEKWIENNHLNKLKFSDKIWFILAWIWLATSVESTTLEDKIPVKSQELKPSIWTIIDTTNQQSTNQGYDFANLEFHKLSDENKWRVIAYYKSLTELHDAKSWEDTKSIEDVKEKKAKLIRKLSYLISLSNLIKLLSNTQTIEDSIKKWSDWERDIKKFTIPDTPPSYLFKQVIKNDPKSINFFRDSNFNEWYFETITKAYSQLIFELLEFLHEESDKLVREYNKKIEWNTEFKSELDQVVENLKLQSNINQILTRIKEIDKCIKLLSAFLEFENTDSEY